MTGQVRGLLLAAGAGTRMGRPKALGTDPDGTPWLSRSVDALLRGGCGAVTGVLGAAADEAATLVPDGSVATVVAADWAAGMGSSLRTGLTALAGDPADAVLVSLVDLPDVGPEVVRRVLAASGDGPQALARAAYDGTPGHTVLIGRDHWTAVADSATGDSGARGYLARKDVRLVECGDLATGRDVDTFPEA